MDSPFFTSRWKIPSRPRYAPSVTKTTPSPKVVSIPVHFVGSERSRSDSALKIQKVFRGFLARKSVKKIAAIKREVDEVEKRISKKENLESIRSDPKERLRVNETLMSLLFRLDSVRGVDSGVRDCRKSVIKKTIALQELLDAIVAGEETIGAVDEEASDSDSDSEADNTDHQTFENRGKVSVSEVEVETCAANSVGNCNLSANCNALELENRVESNESEKIQVVESMPNLSEPNETLKSQALDQAVDTACENSEKLELGGVEVDTEMETKESEEIVEDHNAVPSAIESESGSSGNPENLVEGVEENSLKQEEEEEDDDDGMEEENVKEGREESKKNRELLEKMMVDNEKMMNLMMELFQRNEMQTKLLSSLSHRVGLLEKAFVCEKFRKKKKRCATAGTVVDGPEKSPDTNKCEKK